jgi:hypothetical protein
MSRKAMELTNGRPGVPRGTRPDAETVDTVILIKRVSQMRATYQVRLLAFMASQRGKTLVIEVPDDCVIHDSLHDLIERVPDTVRIVRRQ